MIDTTCIVTGKLCIRDECKQYKGDRKVHFCGIQQLRSLAIPYLDLMELIKRLVDLR